MRRDPDAVLGTESLPLDKGRNDGGREGRQVHMAPDPIAPGPLKRDRHPPDIFLFDYKRLTSFPAPCNDS